MTPGEDPPVTLEDPDAGGLPAILAALLTAAVADPAKAAMLARTRGTVSIRVPDVDMAVTLRFTPGRCRVDTRELPGADLRLTMDSSLLLGLSRVPLLAGFPSVLTAEGRGVVRDILAGRLRIGGLAHLGLLRRLTLLLHLD
jgi:hypothetical protein